MEKLDKLILNFIIFTGIFILIISLPIFSGFLTNSLNESGQTIENLTFTGNENITRYLELPLSANVTYAVLNLSGFSSLYTGFSFDTAGSGNERPSGITQNGTYFWIIDNSDDKVYKYYMSNNSYTGESFSLTSANNNPYGITQNGTYFWVVNDLNNLSSAVYKYYMSNNSYTGESFSLTSANTNPLGITQNGTYFWIADYTDKEVYKYYMSNNSYTGESFDTAGSGGSLTSGITQNGTYFWVTDIGTDKVYKYYMSNNSYTGESFSLISANNNPYGITQNGTYFWIIDYTDSEVYQYWMNGNNWSQVGNTISVGTISVPSISSLNSTRIAFIDSYYDQLRTYDFDGIDWSQVGNNLSVSNTINPSITSLNSTRIAFIDSGNDQLRTYDFDGIDWSQVGNNLSISIGNPSIASLNSTRIAFIDSGDKLRTYDFDGIDWSQVGNNLSISIGNPSIASLNSTRIAFIDNDNDQLRTYDFDGIDWSQVGNNLGVSTSPFFQSITSLNSTRIAFIDITTGNLRTYQWDEVSLPTSPYLEVGTPDGTYEWNYSGAFSTSETTQNFSSALNTALDSGACTGGTIVGTNCSIPFLFHSDTAGILQYSAINVTYTLGVNITLLYPTANLNFSSGTNIALNFSNDSVLSTCYWTNNSFTTNYTISNCINTTLTLNDGDWTIQIWANDTSNNGDADSVTFRVDSTAPGINTTGLIPTNNTFNTSTAVNFSANLTDNLGIKNGTFYIYNSTTLITNSTNTTTSTTISFILTNIAELVQGIYQWSIEVFDWAGNIFTSGNRTITIYSLSLDQLSPSDATNTTTLEQTYRCNATTSSFLEVDNISLTILYENNSSVAYSNTTDTSSQSSNQVNETWTLSLLQDNYIWYCNASTNTSNTITSSNRTINFYQDIFILENPSFNNTQVGENTRVLFQHNQKTNNYMEWCNTTLTHPNGNILINNQNSTHRDITDSKQRWYSTSQILINTTNPYIANVTCQDRFSNLYSKQLNATPSYSITTNPDEYNFSAKLLKTETNNFTVLVYDDSDGNINLTLSTLIDQPGNFTFSVNETNITLNNLDNSTNPVIFLFSLNASSLIANGTYDGNITLKNTTFGITYVINFTYAIQPPAGIPKILDTSLASCNSLISGSCAFKQDSAVSGTPYTQTYVLNNSGYYDMTQCNGKISNDFSGGTWYSFNESNFSLAQSQIKPIKITYNPTGVNPGYGVTDGYFYILCNKGDLGDNPTSTDIDNRPYNRIVLNEGTSTQGGGGNEAPPLPQIIIKKVAVNFSIVSLNFQNNIDVSLAKGSVSPRKKFFYVINKGLEPVTLNLACSTAGENASTMEVDICNYVKIQNKTITVSPNVKNPTLNSFEILTPDKAQYGDKFFFNIFATSGEDVEFEISKLSVSSRVTFLSGVYKDSELGKSGIIYPSWIIALIISLIISILNYILFAKGFKLPASGFLVSSLVFIIAFFMTITFL